MNHPIHSLLSPQSGGTNPQQQNQQQPGSKQHPMQQLHHTLHHPHQQPLVNQHQQTMLHFHQTLHHPYSSLHHSQAAPVLPPPPPPQAHTNNSNNNNFNTTNPHQTLSSHQQHQQQQYNMNSSDYSSSTYHIYDQISDLIIIKQQRLERKRQQEHRRKVILLGFAAALLLGALLFLALQALMPQQQQQQQQQATLSSQQQRSSYPDSDLINAAGSPASRQAGSQQQLEDPQLDRPAWAPQPGNSFDASKFQLAGQNQAGIRLPERINQQQQIVNKVISIQQQQPGAATTMMMSDSLLPCSGHGTVIMTTSSQQAASYGGEPLSASNSQTGAITAACKCDPGFWGERCELSATYQPQSNPLLTRCLLTNCNGNGQCNTLGRCQCFGGFFGPQCEFRLPSSSSASASSQSGGSLLLSPSISSQSQQSAAPGAASSSSSPASHQDAIADQQTRMGLSCLNNCNGNGQCTSQGHCKCYPGFTGDSCQERDLCLGQSCSNQGACLAQTGTCQCKFGFRGNQCEIRDDQQLQRLFNCSSHGKFDYQERKCICDLGYAGLNCSEERCELADGQQQAVLDCGSNGLFDCRQGKCICQDGYSGDQCQIQQCSAQCLRNGQCIDGVCVCQQQGFYGKHCSLNGCPNQCSGRGQCVRVSSESSLASASSSSPSSTTNTNDNNGQQQATQPEWKCQCQPGSTGDDCGILVERQCDDGIDNDRDGLVDCADSECCSDKVCQNSTLCMKSPDPLDILMRKQPPPPTSSFFQRMQFLIEKFSSQIYSNPKDFNDSIAASRYFDRASVIRGRVSYLKQGVTGVRVSVAGQINLGITLTREGGYFDLMVNGGSAVVIEFRREPFATKQKAVRVPWNEIVLMDPVELSLDTPSGADVIINTPSSGNNLGSPLPEPDVPSCSAHNYRLMRPQIVAAPKSSRKSQLAVRASKLLGNQQQSTSRAIILRDSGVVQQSILLPGSSIRDIKTSPAAEANQSVSLIYISSRANEFMSTISLQLTPPANSFVNNGNGFEQFKLPPELKLIHLKIVIEGNLFEQLFEPQTNLSFTYAWNRRNVYRQKSFGLSTASVSVGYEYYDCRHVIWTSKHLQLPGHDLSISDIGQQWNLNIHHRYNYRDSILQRGDGQNFNLKTDKPKIVQTLMGDGYQRQAICPYCDGATSPSEQRLLKPQALVSAPDGSLYVGDFNMIRKIETTPQSFSSSLSSSSSSASSSSSSSQSAAKNVVVRTILELSPARVPSKYSLALNLADQKLFMSDIDRHQIYMIKEQGKQQQLATQASLSSPQQPQLALDSGLVDNSSNSSLSLPEDNLIPVVGSGIRCQLNDRANCGDGQLARLARLNEPRALVFDLNNRMFIADGPNVRMVDTDNKIYTILGDYGTSRHTKFPCSGEAIPMHKFVPRKPLDLAMNPLDDTLHLLDDNVVYKITQDKRVQIVAGRLAHCPPTASSSDHSSKVNGKQLRATEIFLQSAQSIVFSQNGELFISEDDQKQMISRVLLVSPDEDTISLYAGLPIDASLLINKSSANNNANGNSQQQQVSPTVDSIHVDSMEAELLLQQQENKQRSSNILPLSQTIRASDYKFNSVAAITVDQQGNLIVADRMQLRILSIEPDLPQINAAGEYELQSPDNGDELLVFNRYGHHIATREISSGQTQRTPNKYTFSYNVNTSFGQLASVGYSNGNKISIYRDGPHHSVKMIETAFGGQCKLDISRNGQVHSISTMAPNTTKTNFSYHVDGGLLKQSRDQASGEVFDFSYDEFGRAVGIQHSSPRLPAPIDCRTAAAAATTTTSINSRFNSNFISQHCSALIVAE